MPAEMVPNSNDSATGDREPSPRGTLKIVKKAERTGKPLSGAAFGVFDGANRKVAELSTTADGIAAVPITVGDYYLLELEAPIGYLTETARIPFKVSSDAVTLVEVTNERGEKLEIDSEDMPFGTIEISKTGIDYPMLNTVLAYLCFTAAAICGVLLNKAGVYHRRQCRRPQKQRHTPVRNTP